MSKKPTLEVESELTESEAAPEIALTLEEAKTLKQVVFRNYFTALDPAYRKVGDREENTVRRGVDRNIQFGLIELGLPKSFE